MSKISKVFFQVYRPLVQAADAGEEFEMGSMRKQFIHNVTTTDNEEIKLTKNGAASYFQMCKKRASGEDMYAAHKKWNKSNAKPAAPEVDMNNRWFVGNKETQSVFASFTSRTAAQEHNKALKAKGIQSAWIDGQKSNIAEFKPARAA